LTTDESAAAVACCGVQVDSLLLVLLFCGSLLCLALTELDVDDVCVT